MLLQPAFADSDPPSNVSVIVELGAIVCVPVTSVATKLSPSSSLRGARPDGDACVEPDVEPVPIPCPRREAKEQGHVTATRPPMAAPFHPTRPHGIAGPECRKYAFR